MAEKPVNERTQAEIAYSILEYVAQFEKPIIEAWIVPGTLIAAMLNALERWGFKLEGVESRVKTEKLSEYALVFKRTTPIFPAWTVTVGTGKLTITAENIDWTEAESLIGTMNAAMTVIVETARIQSQHLALAMHIQLKTKPRKDVTAPLVSPQALKLLDGEVRFPGLILHREKSSIIIDASAAHANGLFVKILREHAPGASPQMLAEALRRDEEQLFDVLGLEGIL
jgi:hypothetical protein